MDPRTSAQWESPDRSGLTGGLQVRALPLEPFLLSFSPNNLHSKRGR